MEDIGLYLIFMIAMVVLVYIMLPGKREGFAAEFVDHSKERKNDLTRVSSYSQETNHFKPVASLHEPIPGLETPFRVNLYNSFME
jgi:hypothetical protein